MKDRKVKARENCENKRRKPAYEGFHLRDKVRLQHAKGCILRTLKQEDGMPGHRCTSCEVGAVQGERNQVKDEAMLM